MKDIVNILLLGAGGREAAVAWKLTQSPRLGKLYRAPFTGTQTGIDAGVDPMDFETVAAFCRNNDVDVVFVGPEAPLVAGIADALEPQGIKVIGPLKAGARLEGSKEYAKEFMYRHHIPTARYMSVTADTLGEGVNFLRSLRPPYVLKADGLAAGKGVIITPDIEEAEATLRRMLDGMFGAASQTVLIEEFLTGRECSVFVATDGDDWRLLPVAKDYKRVGEGDTGPNTGGMGAVSPVCFADDEFMRRVKERIVEPTVRGLREEGADYRGFIFLGLIDVEGDPYVIEYNVRLGDPETEVVMPRLASDLIDLIEGIADRTLGLKKVEEDPRAAVTVMLVSGGYPGSYPKGYPMTGLGHSGCLEFHAGTRLGADGDTLTDGGRVIALTAYGADTRQAAARALEAAGSVDFKDKYYRRDIGADVCGG